MITTPNRPTKPENTNAPPRPEPRVFLPHIGDEIARNLSLELAIRPNSDIALPPNLKRRRI